MVLELITYMPYTLYFKYESLKSMNVCLSAFCTIPNQDLPRICPFQSSHPMGSVPPPLLFSLHPFLLSHSSGFIMNKLPLTLFSPSVLLHHLISDTEFSLDSIKQAYFPQLPYPGEMGVDRSHSGFLLLPTAAPTKKGTELKCMSFSAKLFGLRS